MTGRQLSAVPAVLLALFVVSCGSSSDDQSTQLISTWDLDGGGVNGPVPVLQSRVSVTMPLGTRGAALSPRGDQLALVGISTEGVSRAVVSIYDALTGAFVRSLVAPSLSNLERRSLVWSTDGSLTVFGSNGFTNDRWLTWDPATGQVIGESILDEGLQPCDDFGFFPVAFNAVRNLMAKKERGREGRFVLCRFDLQNLVVNISDPIDVPGFVGQPRFSPDGLRMSFTWYSSEIANSGVLGTRIVDASTLQPTGVEFPPQDGEIKVLGDDFHVGLGNELWIIPGRAPIDSSWGTITSDSGATVLASRRPDVSNVGDDSGIRLITLPDAIVIGDVFESEDELRSFSADGSTIAVANENVMEVYTLDSRTGLTAVPVLMEGE